MKFNWLRRWHNYPIRFHIRVPFSCPDGSHDLCMRCSVQRQFHRRSSDHAFVEKESMELYKKMMNRGV